MECAEEEGEVGEACCPDSECGREEGMSCMAAVRVVKDVGRRLGREVSARDIEALVCEGQAGECWVSEVVLAQSLAAILQ